MAFFKKNNFTLDWLKGDEWMEDQKTEQWKERYNTYQTTFEKYERGGNWQSRNINKKTTTTSKVEKLQWIDKIKSNVSLFGSFKGASCQPGDKTTKSSFLKT